MWWCGVCCVQLGSSDRADPELGPPRPTTSGDAPDGQARDEPASWTPVICTLPWCCLLCGGAVGVSWRRACAGVAACCSGWLLLLRGCWLRGCWLPLRLRAPPRRTRWGRGTRGSWAASRSRPRRGSGPEGPEDDEFGDSPSRPWLLFNVGATDSATPEPVLKRVRIEDCVSTDVAWNGESKEFAAEASMIACGGNTADNLTIVRRRRTSRQPGLPLLRCRGTLLLPLSLLRRKEE